MRYTILLVCFAGSLFAQKNNVNTIRIDATHRNFEKFTAIAEPSLTQIDTIMALTMRYCQSNKDTCFLLSKIGIEKTKRFDGELVQARAMISYGDALKIYGNLNESEKYLIEAKNLLDELNERSLSAHTNVKLGELDFNRGNNKEAITHFLNAIEVWQLEKDSQFIFQPYMNIAGVYYNMSEFDKAQDYLSKAIDWAELLNNERGQMYGLANQAELYMVRINEYTEIADTMQIGEALYRDTIAMFIKDAEFNVNKSLMIAEKLKDENLAVNARGIMMDLEMQKQNYAAAIEQGRASLVQARKLGAPIYILRHCLNLSTAYREVGQLNASLQYGKEAHQIAEKNTMEGFSAMAMEELYKSYKEIGNEQEALKYLEEFNEYETEKNRIASKKTIAEAEAKFQVVEKEKLILEQNNDILQLESDRAKAVKQRNYLVGGGLLFALLSFLGIRFNKLKKDRNDKKEFAEALIFAQEEERKRIARDLHDGIGQSLLLIKKQMAGTHEATIQNQELISSTLEEVRSISQDLHPFHLEKFGLTASIDSVVKKVEKSSKLFITSELDDIDDTLLAKSEIHLFRTIQEAFNNIVKHAEATAAKITIHKSSRDIQVIIQDNGKGFDQELTVAKSKSLGLKTMHERITAIGGQFKINSGDPKGTQVSINIPLFQKNQ